jgi:hypothetical protein
LRARRDNGHGASPGRLDPDIDRNGEPPILQPGLPPSQRAAAASAHDSVAATRTFAVPENRVSAAEVVGPDVVSAVAAEPERDTEVMASDAPTGPETDTVYASALFGLKAAANPESEPELEPEPKPEPEPEPKPEPEHQHEREGDRSAGATDSADPPPGSRESTFAERIAAQREILRTSTPPPPLVQAPDSKGRSLRVNPQALTVLMSRLSPRRPASMVVGPMRSFIVLMSHVRPPKLSLPAPRLHLPERSAAVGRARPRLRRLTLPRPPALPSLRRTGIRPSRDPRDVGRAALTRRWLIDHQDAVWIVALGGIVALLAGLFAGLI